jgi:hypothetical protein
MKSRLDLIRALNEVRLLMLAEEEHERASAQKRLVATGYEPGDVSYEPRYRRVGTAFLSSHAAVARLVVVLLEPMPASRPRHPAAPRARARSGDERWAARDELDGLVDGLQASAVEFSLRLHHGIERMLKEQQEKVNAKAIC